MSMWRFSFVIWLLVAGCDVRDEDGPKASVFEASPATSTTAAAHSPSDGQEQLVTYRFDQRFSKIEFALASRDGNFSKVKVFELLVSSPHAGSFARFSGSVEIPGNDLTRGRLTAEIDMTSISVPRTPDLADRMKGPVLLDIAQFPNARFTSTSIREGGVDGARHTVTGQFELHGQTRTISFPASLLVSADTFDASAQFTINRHEFGIVAVGLPDEMIKEDVLIKLGIHAAL